MSAKPPKRRKDNAGTSASDFSPKIQIQPSVRYETNQRLLFEVERNKRRFTKGDLIDQAVMSHFSGLNKSTRDQLFRRLDALSEKLDAHRQETVVLVEAFHLYVAEFMTLTHGVPEDSRVEAEQEGAIRLERFMSRLARSLEDDSGMGLINDLPPKPLEN